jgi:hypothetical protein
MAVFVMLIIHTNQSRCYHGHTEAAASAKHFYMPPLIAKRTPTWGWCVNTLDTVRLSEFIFHVYGPANEEEYDELSVAIPYIQQISEGGIRSVVYS